MKSSKLKPLIKNILREIYKKKLQESSGTLYEFEIEFENLVIPGISTQNDLVYVDVNIEYEATSDIPARGMFGPPENSSPAESGDFSITDHSIGGVKVLTNGQGQPKDLDIRQLSPQQQQIVQKAVSDYLDNNEDEIQDKVLDTTQNDFDYPEPPEREDF
jgi:hypothetical protein